MIERDINARMTAYEGLVQKTALMLRDGSHPVLHGHMPVDLEVEDIQQIIRMKIFRGLRAFDPKRVTQRSARGRTAEEKYIFMVVFDQCRDLAKRRRSTHLYIEDVSDVAGNGDHSAFEDRYMSVSQEETYGGSEDTPVELPSTLTERERQVLDLLQDNYRQIEVATRLDISKRDVEGAVRGIRTKMADWQPTSEKKPRTKRVRAVSSVAEPPSSTPGAPADTLQPAA